MISYLKTFIVVFFFLIVSCKKKEQISEYKKNAIDIKVPESKDEGYLLIDFLSDYFFVVLENNDKSFISKTDRVFTVNGKIVVFDDVLNKICVFTKTGKFLNEIGKIGSAPGEFIDASDVVVDNNILVLDINRRTIYKYGLDGKYIGDIKLSFPSFKFSKISNSYGFFVGYYSSDYYNLLITDEKIDLKYKFFRFPKNPNEDLMKYSFTGHITTYNNNFLYSDALSSNIYEINPTNGRKILKYRLLFNKNPWNEDDIYKHQTFFNKIQRGQVSFLRNEYEENKDALVFCYNHSVEDNPKVRVNYQKTGFLLKLQKNRSLSHYNFEKDSFYKYLGSPKGKTEDDKFFISTIVNVESVLNDSTLVTNPIFKKFNKIYPEIRKNNGECTVLFFYRFKN